MNLATLKAEHPAVFEAAVKEERDRVVAHLTYGRASGDMQTAMKAVEDGDGITESLKAKYFEASMKKNAIGLREDENLDVGTPPAPKTASETMEAKIAAIWNEGEEGTVVLENKEVV